MLASEEVNFQTNRYIIWISYLSYYLNQKQRKDQTWQFPMKICIARTKMKKIRLLTHSAMKRTSSSRNDVTPPRRRLP